MGPCGSHSNNDINYIYIIDYLMNYYISCFICNANIYIYIYKCVGACYITLSCVTGLNLWKAIFQTPSRVRPE